MPPRVRLYPWLLWIALILQGVLFISTTAIWDGFDEPFHYAYIQALAETGTLPVYGKSLVSRELTRSFELTPLSIFFLQGARRCFCRFHRYSRKADRVY